MCSPTRAAMLTGMYQQRFGRIFDSALSATRHRNQGLPRQAVTIAEILREQGYATACFGKWHLGYQPPWLPPDQGFDLFRGLASGDGDFHTHIDRSGNPDWWHNNRREPAEGYTTELLTDYSVDFIETYRNQPFFLYVPHLAIHFPWQGPADPPHRRQGTSYHDDKWGIIPDPENVRPHVKAMVESLDAGVGRIMSVLQKWELDKQTVVIFTSDNGGYLTYGNRFRNISSNGVLRGQKTELYEGGHRVPTIVHWPARMTPAVTAETCHSIDLLPTISALAGVSDDRYPSDGLDLGRLWLRGEGIEPRMLFWRAGSDWAVRSGPWKLVGKGGRQRTSVELFHLGEDVSERHDLSAQRPELVQRLCAAWRRWESDVNASAAQQTAP